MPHDVFPGAVFAASQRRMRDFAFVILAIALAALLIWVLSQNGALNLRDPRGPLFEAGLPTPSPTGTPAESAPRDRFSVASFNIHFGYEAETVASTLRSNGMAESDVV